MEIKPININLKSNAAISLEIQAETCICGMPMFLRKSRDGRIFWSCKSFHSDKKLRKCDHTKDVKCFRCKHGELIMKKNNETNENFYGCTNFSQISDSSCNITISIKDMNDLIKQINDAIKFQLNLRSTQYNANDEKAIKKMLNKTKENKCTNNNKKKITKTKNHLSSFKNIFSILNKNIKTVAVLGILFFTFMGIIQGANVEFSLFGNFLQFKLDNNANSNNVETVVNKENKTITVKNITDKEVNISNMAIDMNGFEVDFKNLEDTTIKPGETLILNEPKLEEMIQVEMNEVVKEINQTEKESFFENLLNFGSKLKSEAPNEPVFDPDEDMPYDYYYEGEVTYQMIDSKDLVEQLWSEDNDISITAQIVEKGKKVVEDIKTITKDKAHDLKDRIFDREDEDIRRLEDSKEREDRREIEVKPISRNGDLITAEIILKP